MSATDTAKRSRLIVSWEELSVELELPEATTYVTIQLVAAENVMDEPSLGPEFDGHFADKVGLVFVE